MEAPSPLYLSLMSLVSNDVQCLHQTGLASRLSVISFFDLGNGEDPRKVDLRGSQGGSLLESEERKERERR